MVVIAQGFWVRVVIVWEPLACVVVVEWWPCAHVVVVAQGFWVRIVVVAQECCACVVRFCGCIVPTWGTVPMFLTGFVAVSSMWGFCGNLAQW